MIDYFSKLNDEPLQEKTFHSSLVEASEQFSNKFKNSKKLVAYVSTTETDSTSYMKIVLTLMTLDNKSPYYYNLVEIKQEIGQNEKSDIQSFTNPPSEKETISLDELDNYLVDKVFGSHRFKIVLEMLTQMGRTIKGWESE